MNHGGVHFFFISLALLFCGCKTTPQQTLSAKMPEQKSEKPKFPHQNVEESKGQTSKTPNALANIATPALIDDTEFNLSPGYKCVVSLFKGEDIWVSVFYYERPLFDFRIGAGGSIAEMRDATNNYKSLLMLPSKTGPEIDRVVQEVFWAYNLYPNPIPWINPHSTPTMSIPLTWYSVNMNQAGTEAGDQKDPFNKAVSVNDSANFSRILDVKSNPQKCSFDIISINDKHFLERWALFPRSFKIEIPTLTQIRLHGPGIIRVKNHMLIGQFDAGQNGAQIVRNEDVNSDGAPSAGTPGQVLTGKQEKIPGLISMSSWIPLNKDLAKVAFFLSNLRSSPKMGQGDWYYNSDSLANGLPPNNFPLGEASLDKLNGYAAYYNDATQSGITIIFGKEKTKCSAGGDEGPCPSNRVIDYRMRPHAFGNNPTSDRGYEGPIMAPSDLTLGVGNPVVDLKLLVNDLPIGTMIEKTYEISRFHGLDNSLVELWTKSSQTLPTSRVFFDLKNANNSSQRDVFEKLNNFYKKYKSDNPAIRIEGLASHKLGLFKTKDPAVLSRLGTAQPFGTGVTDSCETGKPKIISKVFEYKKVYVPSLGREVGLRAYAFYPPSNVLQQNLPVIAMFHGGGWAIGSPTFYFPASFYFATRGAVVVTFQYRLSKVHQSSSTDSTKDAKSAIRWLKQNASSLGIDPSKVFTLGDSAGAHLALTATFPNAPSDETGTDATPTNVKSVFAFYPVIEAYGSIGAPDYEVAPLGLLNSVDPKDVPLTILLQGTGDTHTPISLAEKFCGSSNLKKENSCYMVPFQNLEHGFLNATSGYRNGMAIVDSQLIAQGVLPGNAADTYANIGRSLPHCNPQFEAEDNGNYWTIWDSGYGFKDYPYGAW